MADIPAMIRMTLREPRLKHPSVKWLQELMNESPYVCGLPEDGELDPRSAQEISELLYRLGHPTYPAALSIDDFWKVVGWANGGNLPNEWQVRRLSRMHDFKKGHGITQASWECLHPAQFPTEPPASDYARIMATAVSGGSYGYGDPEGQGGRHWAIDWFGIEGQGTIVNSPANGKIVRVSASVGNAGQIFGGVLSVREPNGWLWVMRHCDPKRREGDTVSAGEYVANVTRWRDGGDHVHMELYDERSRGDDRIYVGPPINRNPYLFLREHGAL